MVVLFSKAWSYCTVALHPQSTQESHQLHFLQKQNQQTHPKTDTVRWNQALIKVIQSGITRHCPPKLLTQKWPKSKSDQNELIQPSKLLVGVKTEYLPSTPGLGPWNIADVDSITAEMSVSGLKTSHCSFFLCSRTACVFFFFSAEFVFV